MGVGGEVDVGASAGGEGRFLLNVQVWAREYVVDLVCSKFGADGTKEILYSSSVSKIWRYVTMSRISTHT